MTTAAPRNQAESGLLSLGRRDWSTWPKYEAAVLGFRNYWYPVTWSRKVGSKRPIQVTVLGEKVMLIRDGGKVRALNDRCPHRGVPLSHPMASREFPGTWSCCYHGWTFDLETGTLVAVITDGPESPICGKVAVRTYPVEERLGLVWVFVGDGTPPPVEADIPSELLAPGTEVQGRITIRDGNWRFAAENGFDDGHAKYLHRKTLWTLRRLMPAWTRIHIEETGEGWITRVADEVHYETDYPSLGSWPKRPPWRTRGRGGARTSIRLPAMLRVKYAKWAHYEWWVGRQEDQHIYIQLVGQQGGPLSRLIFRLYYRLWVRWIFHGLFNDEDRLMVDVMDAPPERLYRPDISITEWRKQCEINSRGRPQGPDDPRVAAARRNIGGAPELAGAAD